MRKVKDNFGNVEIDSIQQANAINTTGVYKVGRIYEEQKKQHFQVTQDIYFDIFTRHQSPLHHLAHDFYYGTFSLEFYAKVVVNITRR